MSTTRLPPMRLCRTTVRPGFSSTLPTRTEPCETGTFFMTSSARVGLRGGNEDREAAFVGHVERIEAEDLAGALHRLVHRDQRFFQLDADVPVAQAISFSVVARPPRVRSRRQCTSIPALKQRLDRRPELARVAHDWRFEFQAFAHRENRDAVAAEIAADDDRVAGLRPMRADRSRGFTFASITPMPEVLTNMPSPLPLSTTLVSPVTSFTPACRRGLLHRRDHGAQRFHRQAFFENESRAQIERARAAHGQIVDRAVDRQIADVAAGKNQRAHHERIGGEGQTRAVDSPRQPRRRAALEHRVRERRHENLFDELMGERPPPPCASTMRSSATRGTGQLRLNSPWRLASAIVIVGRAGALGGDHGRAERVLGRALHGERRALVRLLDALQDQAADALGGLVRAAAPMNGKRRFGVEFPEASAQPEAAGRESRRCRATARCRLRTLRRSSSAPGDSLRAARRGCTGSRLRRGRLRAALTAIRMPSSRSSGSKPVTTIGTWYFARDRLIFLVAHDGADVAGGEESLHPQFGDDEHAPPSRAAPARATPAARNSRRRRASACHTAIALAGAVVSKPTAKKTTCLSGLRLRQLQRRPAASRRCARRRPRPWRRTGSSRAGHAQHVAERAEDHVRAAWRWRRPCRSVRSASRRPGSRGRAPA